MLQRPVGGQLDCFVPCVKNFVHDSVGIIQHCTSDLAAVGHTNQQSTAGKGTVVNADGIFCIAHIGLQLLQNVL